MPIAALGASRNLLCQILFITGHGWLEPGKPLNLRCKFVSEVHFLSTCPDGRVFFSDNHHFTLISDKSIESLLHIWTLEPIIRLTKPSRTQSDLPFAWLLNPR
ncbi:hypothetical protein GDO86_014782 [Hymenochirus boettgeri]|uniref:Uncharacterized protein n=1 Tax=Hymenochirus boettgeri TaxID=247094 RepID=A0A8T2JQC2_9PIPI|nr:hypothetical protein GDO86_014782 [Hymenochirus boettgeri]